MLNSVPLLFGQPPWLDDVYPDLYHYRDDFYHVCNYENFGYTWGSAAYIDNFGMLTNSSPNLYTSACINCQKEFPALKKLKAMAALKDLKG